MAAKPCTEPGCPYRKKERHPKWCIWHWLLQQPIDEQVKHAKARRKKALEPVGVIERTRVPAEEWPDGERFCAGCQSFVPLFYCRGNSQCWADASASAHNTRLKATYGIDSEVYAQLYEWQGGRCYICQRKSTRRLAVDHDHETGAVRGLLCPDPTRGCNHAILGNIRDIAMAQRIVDYLQRPPLDRLRAGEPGVNAGRPSKAQRERELYQESLDAYFPSRVARREAEMAQAAAGRPPAPPPVAAVVSDEGGYVPAPLINSPF